MAPDGACPTGTQPITAEMLHVWLVKNPDGPFAERLPAESVAHLDGPQATGGALDAGASLIDWRGVMAEVGDLLDLSLLQLRLRYEAGASLGEMADSQGVERASLVDTIERRVAADLERAVASGDMTAGQRDLILRQMPAQVERMVEIHEGEPWLTGPSPTPTA